MISYKYDDKNHVRAFLDDYAVTLLNGKIQKHVIQANQIEGWVEKAVLPFKFRNGKLGYKREFGSVKILILKDYV